VLTWLAGSTVTSKDSLPRRSIAESAISLSIAQPWLIQTGDRSVKLSLPVL
jgi:hypothetical protein